MENDIMIGSILLKPDYEKNKERYDKNAESICAYEEHYMKLLRNYKREIQEIQEMLKNIREERQQFFLETLPQIEYTIENDNILSEENKQVWIQDLRENMEKSFSVSEEIVNHYVTENLKEFKEKLKEVVYGVK